MIYSFDESASVDTDLGTAQQPPLDGVSSLCNHCNCAVGFTGVRHLHHTLLSVSIILLADGIKLLDVVLSKHSEQQLVALG